MARYFKFKRPEDLLGESQRLGLNIRLSEDLSPLTRPVSIGRLKAGNSWCILPMEGCDGELDGRPGPLTLRRYKRFGGGGAKVIWGEATAVIEEGRANSRQILLNEQTKAEFARMLEGCLREHRSAFGTADDLVVGLQLTHSGRYSYRQPLLATHDGLLDRRTVMDKQSGRLANAGDPLLTDDYLKRLVDQYVSAARLAWQVGFRFVDIKQCHRYLLSELLGARSRPGAYGGCLENRTRLAREIFQAIRASVPGLELATRLNVYDGLPYNKAEDGLGAAEPCSPPINCAWGTMDSPPHGPDLAEPLWWIGQMRQLGVSLVCVTMGNPYASPHIIRPFEYPPPDGYETPEPPLVGVDRHFRLTAQIQAAFPDLVVVGSGYSYLQEFIPQAGAANLRDGRVTLVGVGRAALPQPDFARQVAEHGCLERKRVCRTFSYCTALMRAKHHPTGQFATGCPPFDKEVYGPIWEEAKRKPDEA